MKIYKFISDFMILLSIILGIPVVLYSLNIRSWWPVITFIVVITIIDLYAKSMIKKTKSNSETG